MNASSPAPDGTPFGRYRLLALLGEGGMGSVHQAWDAELGRMVALKRLKPLQGAAYEGWARFLREARLAAKLAHPGIVRVYGIEEIDGQSVIAMEYVEGRTLAAELEGPPAEGDALRRRIGLLVQVARAVAHAHAQGVLHRDLKPQNVLLDAEGRAHVADFGMAKELELARSGGETRLTASGQALGTPSYMSPEQAVGDAARIGVRSDVWALGAILFQILAGRPPFDRASVMETLQAVVLEETPLPRRSHPGTSEGLEAICLQALEKEPARRYVSADEMAADLQRWLDGETVRAQRPDWRYRIIRRLRRARRPLIGIGALLLAAAALLAYAADQRARAEANAAAVLTELTRTVEGIEQQVMTVAMSPEARRSLSAQSLALFDRRLQENPDLGVAYAWRGRVKDLLGDRSGAEADFDQGCARAPERAVVWYLRGWHRLDAHARGRSLPTANADPGKVEFHPAPRETPEETRLREAGLADLERMARAAVDDVSFGGERVRLGRAIATLSEGAGAGHEEVLRLVDGIEQPLAWRLRGRALHLMGRFAEAEKAFDHVLEKWPEDEDAWISRGLARHGVALQEWGRSEDVEKDLRGALADYTEALRRAPESGRAYMDSGAVCVSLAGLAQNRRADPTEALRAAIAHYDQAIGLDPRTAAGWQARGSSWLVLARNDDSTRRDPRESLHHALADLEEAVRLDPESWLARLWSGMAFQFQGQLQFQRSEDPEAALSRALVELDAAQRWHGPESEFRWPRAFVHMFRAQARFARGLDPRESAAAAAEDYTAAMKFKPGDSPLIEQRASAWGLHARADWVFGADPRPRQHLALEGLGAAVAAAPDAQIFRQELCFGLLALAQYEAAAGGDPRDALREGLAAADEAIRRAPEAAGYVLLARAGMHRALGIEEEEAGRDPASEYALAEQDYRAAIGLRQILVAGDLGLLLRLQGKNAAALEQFRSYAAAGPTDLATTRRHLVDTDARLAAGNAPWVEQLRLADLAALTSRGERARARCAKALELLEAEAGARRDDPDLRAAFGSVHEALAFAERDLALGRAGDGRAADPSERAAHADRMFAHLAEAARLGVLLRGLDQVQDFLSFRSDPRLTALLAK